MQAEVYFADTPVGTLAWIPDAYGVQIELDCAQPDAGAALLRCYGETDGGALRIGLPAPQSGRLRLSRHLSRESLRAAGCAQTLPKRFYLSEHPEPVRSSEPEEVQNPPEAGGTAVRTGDTVLDGLLDSGAVQAEADGASLVLRCAFSPGEPFALAPAFVLCTVENGTATLRWTKKDAAEAAASGNGE